MIEQPSECPFSTQQTLSIDIDRAITREREGYFKPDSAIYQSRSHWQRNEGAAIFGMLAHTVYDTLESDEDFRNDLAGDPEFNEWWDKRFANTMRTFEQKALSVIIQDMVSGGVSQRRSSKVA